ncbi:YibE/F family protein [Nocardioides daejeonensis]|uniref:YibE/F family protein n=1 Tax=Nocardioides daejeonensis TaxID=1046556 RepID=UPI00194F295D|nr:YibE/F family protein [Nocardioides daejeonensis]
MGHHHGRHAAPETRTMLRVALWIVGPLALLTLISMVWLWPTDGVSRPEEGASEEFKARITALHAEPCAEKLVDDVNGCGRVTIELESGPDRGSVREVAMPNGPGAPIIDDGDDVLVIVSASPDGEVYSITDHQRGPELWILCAAFVLVLLVFGRWRGLTALAGLVVTFAVLLLFVVPALLAGESPLLVAIVASAAITLVVLYLTHGLSLATTVAVLGTLASLALTGVLALLSVALLNLSGVTDDVATAVVMMHGIDMRGLLIASIVIGSLGVLDDVTVTQSATVAELAHANPAYRFRELYRAASRVGRSHIASVVNTIVLAYAGSSLPLLVLIVANNSSLSDVVTTQLIAQEVVRSAVATIGLIAAVPLTTALAALAVRTSQPRTG